MPPLNLELPPGLPAEAAPAVAADLYELARAGCPTTQAARRSLERVYEASILQAGGYDAGGVATIPFDTLAAAARNFCTIWQKPGALPATDAAALARVLNPRGQAFVAGLRNLISLSYGASDFPYILSSVAEKILLAAAAVVQPSWRRWGRIVRLARVDLPVTAAWTSPVGPLPKVPEGAELTHSKFLADNGTTMYGYKYGVRWNISKEALLRDDLGALSEPARVYGSSVPATEDDLVYGSLVSNPVMPDGKQLFCADHANLMTGSVLDATNLNLARRALAAQSAPNSQPLRLQAKVLIVPVALAETASALLRSLGNADQPPDARLELLVEPRLDLSSTAAWYLAASPGLWPALVVGLLDGSPAPLVDAEWGFDVDSLRCKVRAFFGFSIADHRGLVFNPGV